MTYMLAHSLLSGYQTHKQLGWLGDDNTTLENLGFNSSQVQQIVSGYQQGTIPAAAYQAIISGQVSPANLSDFLATNTGITAQPLQSGGNVVAVSDVGSTLTTGPSPTVAEPAFNLWGWLTGSTSIAGVEIPNIGFVGVGVGALLLMSEKKGRKH
jgi:DNA-binding transcriptional regulator YdaS (Cro superfamily)